MFDRFLNLDRERKDRIINAAFKEFSVNGYEDASTNVIARDAGISKGLLFHYIGSKKDLFLFLCSYTIAKMKEDIFGQINMEERDLLERLRQIALVKVDLLYKYPQLFNFAIGAFYSQSEEIKEEMGSLMKDITALKFQKLFEDIDESKFRGDIEPSKIKNLIIWALNGYSDSLAGEFKGKDVASVDYDKSLAEFDSYIDAVRKCFYK